MGRFARSWDLTKTSLRIVRQNKSLLWMPILSGIASLLAILAVTGVGFGIGVLPQATDAQNHVNPVAFVLLLAMYILLAFVTLFFNAAVIAAATQSMKGETPTVGSALRAASGKLGKIFVWAIVVGTVNLLLQILREMASRERSQFGQIVSSILISIGASLWNLATAFMVPVLLFEDKPLADSFRSSVSIVKRTWGETVIGNVGLGLASFVASLAVLAVAFVLFMLLAPVGVMGMVFAILVGVLGLVGVAALFSVLGGVYRAALYRFATTGQAAGGFSQDQLSGAFLAKGTVGGAQARPF